jgi:hypothetical protein
MALSKGAKIALGCGLAAVLAAGAAVVVVGGLAWWGIGKAKEATEGMVAEQEAAEKDLRKANAHPFTAPADGVVQEDRLVKFLAVRKRIHDDVYLKHKDTIEAEAQKEKADISALAKLPLIIAELHAAKARGLAEQGMSEAEFNWLFGTVYGNLILDGMAKGGDGTSVADANRASVRAAAEAAEQAARAAEANPALPAEAKQQLRQAADRAREEAARATQMTGALDVPPANRALFEKRREEILEYTMGGLELLPF